MALKKKVLVGTLATTLAVGAFAGLPLSGKGLAEKLGTGVASAAASDIAQSKLDSLKPYLSQPGKDAIKNIYADLKLVPASQHITNFAPLIDALPVEVVGTSEQQQALIDLLFGTGLPLFPPDVDGIATQLKNDSNVTALISSLQTKLGVDFTVDNLTEFSLGLIGSVNTVMAQYQPEDILDPAKRLAAAHQVFDTEIAKPTVGAKFYKAIRDDYFDGSSDDLFTALTTVYHNYDSVINKQDLGTALVALAAAYKAANPVYFPGGGAGGGVSSNVTVSQALGTINALKAQLANATDEEKAKLIKEALDQASAALTKAAAVDVTGKIVIEGDKASVKIDANDVAAYIDAVKLIKDALVNALGSADALVIPNISFDLGTVAQANVATSIPADVLTSLSDVGVQGASITVNGLTATLPITGDFAKGIDFGINKTAVQDGQTKGLTSVSDVYNFSLSLGGEVAEQFAQPIVVKFPVKDVDGVDKELLSVVRIESDGSLSPQGGDLDGNTIIEPRYTFSSYTVVENKVSFNDIDSVQSWAGRQIEVIAAKGAIEGKAAGVFAPKDDITRAEFAKILITALNLDNSLATSDKFSDVKSGDWFAPYVAVAADKGIINGRSATKFDPTAKITRAEMATMIARALKLVKGIEGVDDTDVALAGFSDAGKINPTLKDGVALAASKNIVIGDNGKFRPNDNANRAEAAVIIYRAVNTKA